MTILIFIWKLIIILPLKYIVFFIFVDLITIQSLFSLSHFRGCYRMVVLVSSTIRLLRFLPPKRPTLYITVILLNAALTDMHYLIFSVKLCWYFYDKDTFN